MYIVMDRTYTLPEGRISGRASWSNAPQRALVFCTLLLFAQIVWSIMLGWLVLHAVNNVRFVSDFFLKLQVAKDERMYWQDVSCSFSVHRTVTRQGCNTCIQTKITWCKVPIQSDCNIPMSSCISHEFGVIIIFKIESGEMEARFPCNF